MGKNLLCCKTNYTAANSQFMANTVESNCSEVLSLRKKMFSADLATFTEEILNGKPHFLCRV